jgi:hypothetical protein
VRKETAKRLEAEKNNPRPFTMGAGDDELTAAADRHAGDTTLATETVTLDPMFQAEVDRIAGQYISQVPPMTDDELKSQFNHIVSQDPVFRGRNMDERFFSTNILRVLQAKKAESRLDRAINDVLQFQFDNPGNPAINTNYTQLYHQVSQYVRDFGRDPIFRAELDTLLSGVSDGQTLDRGRLIHYLNHINGCARLRINNARLQVDMITTGKGAYEIKTENTGRHHSRTTKVGQWMDKHRWATAGILVAASAGTALLTAGVGGAVMGASVGGLISTGVGSGLIGATNYFKKKSHYTKEVDEYEKRNAMNHQAEEVTMQRHRDIASGAIRASRWQRRKSRAQLRKYAGTTVQQLRDTNTLADALTNLLVIPTQNLSPLQRNQLNENLIHAYAMTELFRQQGRNFLSSQTEAQAEQDMRALEKAIDLGTSRLGLVNRNAIADPAFTAIVNGETINVDSVMRGLEQDYNERLKNFKKKREKLAVKSGLTTAAISFATSAALQKVLGTGMFAKEAVQGTEAQSLSETMSGGRETVGLGGHNLTDGSNNIFTTTKSGLDNANIQGQITEVIINPASGTDATLVKVGKFTNWQDKMTDVINEVSGLNNIPDQSSVIDQIKQIPAELAQHPDFSKFQNGNLEIMRVLEVTEQNLKAYDVSSIAGQGKIVIEPDLASSIAGDLVKEQSQRFLESTITIKSEVAGEAGKKAGNKFLTRVIPTFSNTSKIDEAVVPQPSPSPQP